MKLLPKLLHLEKEIQLECLLFSMKDTVKHFMLNIIKTNGTIKNAGVESNSNHI